MTINFYQLKVAYNVNEEINIVFKSDFDVNITVLLFYLFKSTVVFAGARYQTYYRQHLNLVVENISWP